ncbi:MAG: hypothetical protein JNM84_09655 [Planctomycetes bacterium]|nr:hypothetical protein [Planctomycetota bacterium]
MSRIFFAALFGALCTAALSAQSEIDASRALALEALTCSGWSDPAADGEERLWASGTDFKASFARELRFYPRLGAEAPAYEPFTWRTRSIAVGSCALDGEDGGAYAVDEQRAEREHGGVSERYDLREGGIEQSFLVREHPSERGDLVIRGTVGGSFRAEPRAAAHAELLFRDELGRVILSYGRATAIDARGSSLALTTAYDGEEIELRVPSEWLATAAFPVLVDPLIAGAAIAWYGGSGTDGLVEELSVASSERASGRTLCVAYARIFSSGDRDLYAWACDANWQSPARIFASIDARYDERHPSIAYVAGAQRWVLAYESTDTQSGGGERRVRVYVHDIGSTVENSGTIVSMQRLVGESAGRPTVGGSLTSGGTRALIAYETDLSANVFDAKVRSFDAAVPGFVGLRQDTGLSAAGGLVGRWKPSVTPLGAEGSTGWVVAWEDLFSGGVNTRIAAALYDASGQRLVSTVVATPSIDEFLYTPRVAGLDGRFAFTWLARSNANGAYDEVRSRVVTWTPAALPSFHPVRTVERAVLGTSTFRLGGLAFDTRTRSHWMSAYERLDLSVPNLRYLSAGRVARLGGTGVPRGLYVLPASYGEPTAMGLAFDRDPEGRFAVACGTRSTTAAQRYPVLGLFAEHPTDAEATPYGARCGTSTIRCTEPYIGNLGFEVYLTGANVTAQPAVLLMSALPLQPSFPIDPTLAPGCALNLDPQLLLAALPTTLSGGIARFALPVPDDVASWFDLYFQCAYLQPGLNPLGLGASQGLAVHLR